MKDYDNLNKDQILALVKAKESHISMIDLNIESIIEGPECDLEKSALWYRKRYNEEQELNELKKAYVNACRKESGRTCSGKITIEYEGLTPDAVAELYRTLNTFIVEAPGFNYRTELKK